MNASVRANPNDCNPFRRIMRKGAFCDIEIGKGG